MLYQWHDIFSQSVKLSFQTAANALSFSGSLMNAFNTAASAPAYRDFANNLIQSAKQMDKLVQDQPDGFGLWRTRINGKMIAVNEEVIVDKPFGKLLHFKCETGDQTRNVPKVLIVAPISGHKATILRDTVRELLPDNDVYVTQWKDARDVPLKEGNFTFEDYIGYVQDFIREIGPQTHLIGISQSTVPVLAVTSLMAARDEACQPLSMTLMCGPIDPRINETEVSRLTRKHGLDWIRNNLVTQVPSHYAGRGRNVFPGFLQSLGLSVAAPGNRNNDPLVMVTKVFGGQGEKLDADAPYYLDVIRQYFIEHSLPRGTMVWKDEKVDPSKIRKTGLFTVEGSVDNITAPGQTIIAHKLCPDIPQAMRKHHLQVGAGHYDIFTGSDWSDKISNEYNAFVRNVAAEHGIIYDPPQAETPVKTQRISGAKSVLAA